MIRTRIWPQNSASFGEECVALRIVLRGHVQGFGVRPAIARLADALQLRGYVSNDSAGVGIHLEGPSHVLDEYFERLPAALPGSVQIESLDKQFTEPQGHTAFSVRISDQQGPLRVRIPPDLAVCHRCLAEVDCPGDRRSGYLLTTCTACGPRYSIIRSMPYERERTAMAEFAMCDNCLREYTVPSDRRFHSQTNGCNVCGPSLETRISDGRSQGLDESTFRAAEQAVRSGKVVALRGVGGYQLVVDASSSAAVRRLRGRKQRLHKPLAVMVPSLAMAEQLARLSNAERTTLESPANPIVLVRTNSASCMAAEVSGGLATVGLFLPTTPLHHRLAQRCARPLVVTSGNREGEPIAYTCAGASSLKPLADLWIDSNRPIERPIDDSVVQLRGESIITVRLGRGLAPLSLPIPASHQAVALGGHLKTAIALCNGVQSVLGPHIGDLESEATRQRYLEQLDSLQALYGCQPDAIIHDLHPDYFTTRLAAKLPGRKIAVQHHHAHVAVGMLQHGWTDRQVLGIAWDGTGYGPDGTIWGGEVLLASLVNYQRVGCLRPFCLPGGETAIRQPWRVAVALVADALGIDEACRLKFTDVAPLQVQQMVQLATHPSLSPRTTSAGRLFDGLAALVLGTSTAHFEAQVAMLLEQACDRLEQGAYAMPLGDQQTQELDWRPLVRQLLTDRAAGTAPGIMAMRLHRALANGIASFARRYEALPVVLQGGCFINQVLLDLILERWDHAQLIGLPGMIPTGDGGLAAGQLAIGLSRLSGEPICV